eukprot:338595-Pyramimonas_sp.AAC.1
MGAKERQATARVTGTSERRPMLPADGRILEPSASWPWPFACTALPGRCPTCRLVTVRFRGCGHQAGDP